jgi:GntR family transcriptional regulator
MSNMTRFTIRPLYLQVRDMLVERITSGQWKPGAGISNEVDLSRELGVSVGTVRKALDVMEQEHLITRRQGRGTFVNDQTSDDLATRFNRLCTSSGNGLSLDILKSELKSAKASDEEASRLRLRAGDPVLRIRRIQSKQSHRVMLEQISMPEARFPGLASKSNVSLRIVALAQQFGILLGGAQERVTVTRATTSIAEALGVDVDTPLLELDRVVFSIDGRPIEWRSAMCNLSDGDYYSVDMN